MTTSENQIIRNSSCDYYTSKASKGNERYNIFKSLA